MWVDGRCMYIEILVIVWGGMGREEKAEEYFVFGVGSPTV